MENQDEQVQNPPSPLLGSDGKPLTGAALLAAQTAAKKAQDKAEQDGSDERLAKAIAAIRAVNPDMSIEDIATLVGLSAKKDGAASKADKEASRLIAQPETTYKEKIYLKKDEKRKFPIEREALNGIIVRQTYDKKEEESGESYTVGARNLNELAIYTQADFDRLNNADKNKPGFARLGLSVEVWHRPGDTDTVAE